MDRRWLRLRECAGVLAFALLTTALASAAPDVGPATTSSVVVGAASAVSGADTATVGAPALVAEPLPPVDAVNLAVLEAAVAAAAVAVVAPAAMGLGTAWGSGPSDLLLAALPALLMVTLAPPAAAAAAAWYFGQDVAPGRERFWPTFGVGVAVQLAAVVVAVLAGASTREPRDVVLFTAADALLLAGSTAGSMYLFRPDEAPTASAPRAPVLRLSFAL